ncbi:hypothetical protein CK203_011731 [Vitis vinifera]|uniref:F-box domain-containing protein n=1 Tax=Vitis vinifera TaxID=29760 RepID=A0A438JU28_VITVI|nr:hypothetical protein CK203_011731 [Vitis vinifera]
MDVTDDRNELPEELLELVFMHLQYVQDILRFGVVCRSWSLVASEVTQLFKPSSPILLLPPNNNNKSYRLFSLSMNKGVEIQLEELALCKPGDRVKLEALEHAYLVESSGDLLQVIREVEWEDVDAAHPPRYYTSTFEATLKIHPRGCQDMGVFKLKNQCFEPIFQSNQIWTSPLFWVTPTFSD